MRKVIVFDIDGTLFDTKNGIIKAFNHVLKLLDKEQISSVDESMYVGPPVKQSFINYCHLKEKEAENATHLYRKYYIEKYVKYSTMYDNMELVLQKLKSRGDILCIATMKTKPQLEKLLENSIAEGYFDEIKTASENGSLSKAQMLKEIKEKYGIAEYYMVGDTVGDYEASCSAEMSFIGVTYGYGDLSALNEITLIDNIIDILQVV